MLTTHQLSTLLGCDKIVLRRFAESGAIQPVVNGSKGRGNTSLYSKAQAVALVYAVQNAQYRMTPPVEVVRYLSGLSDLELAKHIDAGETIIAAPGLWLNPQIEKGPEERRRIVRRIDLTRPYRKVTNFMEKLLVVNSKH